MQQKQYDKDGSILAEVSHCSETIYSYCCHTFKVCLPQERYVSNQIWFPYSLTLTSF